MLDLTSKALLVASIRHGMFGSRDTVEEALNYAVTVIKTLDNNDRSAMYTALHVVMNTIADKITALPDQSSAEPEPRAAARIDHADLISDIVDQRIKFQLNGFNKSVDVKIAKAIEEWNENTKFDMIIEEWFYVNVDIENEIKEAINSMSVTINFD